MKRIRLFVCVCLLGAVFGAANGADRDGKAAIKGVGLTTCADYRKAVDSKSPSFQIYLGWLQGFQSATNLLTPDTFDIAPWESNALIALSIYQNCEKQPDLKFADVAARVVASLKPDRLTEGSDIVEMKVGDKKLLVYKEVMRRVQRELAKRGLYDDVTDGLYGEKTAKAVKAFQESQKLPANGVPDARTLLLLFKKSS